MTNQEKYAKAMSKKTDAELIRVLTTDANGYEEEALTAAEIEFENRNLTVEQAEKATKINEKVVISEQNKAEAPLESVTKAFVFIFPIQAIWASGIYSADGYFRKSEEVVRWCGYGLGFYFALIFLLKSC
jgi:hypothetical protein